ncbi:MAG: hypothetical protein CM1200mP30_27390 [Pseudomonadota bacterium]|nr:MAG: hypothetical protein CM1200mP30_27390 [Pseudomonadota bacterium]
MEIFSVIGLPKKKKSRVSGVPSGAFFPEDRIFYYSGYLSYVTLLSKVPLLAVVFFILFNIPRFLKVKRRSLGVCFQGNFLPALGDRGLGTNFFYLWKMQPG